MPCPISERAMRTTMVSSGFTTTQALISGGRLAPASCAEAEARKGTWKPSDRPAMVAPEPTMKFRRETD